MLIGVKKIKSIVLIFTENSFPEKLLLLIFIFVCEGRVWNTFQRGEDSSNSSSHGEMIEFKKKQVIDEKISCNSLSDRLYDKYPTIKMFCNINKQCLKLKNVKVFHIVVYCLVSLSGTN